MDVNTSLSKSIPEALSTAFDLDCPKIYLNHEYAVLQAVKMC